MKRSDDRLSHINSISKCGGSTIYLKRNTSKLSEVNVSGLISNNKSLHNSHVFLSKGNRDLKLNLDSEDDIKTKTISDNVLYSNKILTKKKENDPEKQNMIYSRNKSLNFNLPALNIEYAEKSVELEDDAISNSHQYQKLNLVTKLSKKEYPSRLFKGFEITNISKEVAYSDSPYAKHLEQKSPRVKNKMKKFSFSQ